MAGTLTSGDDRRLDSWKEIAAHLGVSVRTAQRWEKSEGLPVRRHVHDKLGTAYAFCGEVAAWQESRTLAPPARVETKASNAARQSRQSLAVLPFSALDRDEETEPIADGLTDELITSLSQVTSLRVVARASSFHFKGRDLDVRQLRRQLRVGTVLTGQVRRSETVLRVSAQLIDTADGSHLWAQRFEGAPSTYFELEDELTTAVTGALRARIANHPIDHHRPSDVRAYNLFLRARYLWNQRERECLEKALACYREAIEIEPTFASAHAGMAECQAFLWAYADYEWAPVVAAAESAALEALRIEPKSNDGHRSLGVVHVARNDLSAACAASVGRSTSIQTMLGRVTGWRWRSPPSGVSTKG